MRSDSISGCQNVAPHGRPAATYIKRMLATLEASEEAEQAVGLVARGEECLIYEDAEPAQPQLPDVPLPPHTVAVFDAVITSSKEDRDGDRLESRGAIIDPAMPLLWQHLPSEPIGRLLKILNHDEHRIQGRFAIADTPLGRDAALLLKFGALRISHGFRPLEYEPLESRQGWHIRRFEIMETSLVSVPAIALVPIEGGRAP